MKRRPVLIMTWLLASGVPLLLAVVLIGCCALPFHGLVHRFMPLCQMAEAAVTAHHHGDHDERQQPAPLPQQKKDGQDGPRLVWKREALGSGCVALAPGTLHQLPQGIAQRSQIAHGALRCDDDVGTRLALLDTLRI